MPKILYIKQLGSKQLWFDFLANLQLKANVTENICFAPNYRSQMLTKPSNLSYRNAL